MVPDVPAVDTAPSEISQIAFVVRDIDDGMERFDAMLGVDQWDVYRFEPPALTDQTYRGDPADYSMIFALTDVGGTMLELIEPMEPPTIYHDHLDEHGEGLHHIACFAYDDPEAVIEEYREAGVPVLQSGVFHEVPYWYFDTEEHLNGVIWETADVSAGLPEPDRTYPE